MAYKQITTPVGVFNIPDERSGEMYAENNDWEKHLRDEFPKYLSSDSNAIDIGAHIGYHTVALSKICSNGTVYCFEPNKKLIPILTENILQNSCHNVAVYPYAVSNITGQTYLTENPNLFLNHITKEETNCRILTTRLDDMLHKLPTIKLIKIDTEGHELEVLRGAEQLLKRDNPIIFIEIWKKYYFEYIAYLSDISYAVYMLAETDFVAFRRS